MAIDTSEYINKVKTGLKSNKNYERFFYTFSHNGKKYRGLIDTSTKKGWGKRERVSYAESEFLKIKEKRQLGITEDKLTLDKYMDKHFSLLTKSSWNTEKENFYKNHIKDFLGKRVLKEIRAMDIKETIKRLEDSGKSARTASRVLEVLKPAFLEAIENRIIEHNPLLTISVKRPPTKKIVTNATDTLISVYKAIHKVFMDDDFYKAFFLFALQGRRKSEILNLRWSDISFEYGYYTLGKTKNGEEQKMFLPDNIKELLLNFKEDTNEYVFTSHVTGDKLVDVRRQVKKIKDEIKDSQFSLHYLRNVISSAMSESGIDSIYQSGALGHSDVNTINKYTSLNYLKGSRIASDIIDGVVASKE
jgi:integrase